MSLDLQMICTIQAGTVQIQESRDLYDCPSSLVAVQRARAIYGSSLVRCQIMTLDGQTIATY